MKGEGQGEGCNFLRSFLNFDQWEGVTSLSMPLIGHICRKFAKKLTSPFAPYPSSKISDSGGRCRGGGGQGMTPKNSKVNLWKEKRYWTLLYSLLLLSRWSLLILFFPLFILPLVSFSSKGVKFTQEEGKFIHDTLIHKGMILLILVHM